MSKFFEELEAQLHAAARAEAEERHSGTEQSRPGHGRLRSWGRAVPVALAVAVTAVVVAVALTVHSNRAPHAPASSGAAGGSAHKTATGGTQTITIPSGATVGGMQVLGSLGHLTAEQQHELSAYITRAQVNAMKTSACRPASARPTESEGSPSSGLLSALGVLRRPAVRSDQPTVPRASTPLYPAEVQGIYVRYVRRAQVKAGISYYVIPGARLIQDPEFTPGCRASQVAVLRSELPRIPAGERASTLALQTRWLALFARIGQPTEGVCLSGFAASGVGGGSCVTAAQAEQGGLQESSGSTSSGVVPDGVATVTVHYAAGNGAAARNFTSRVVGNVFAVHIPGLRLGAGPPPTIIWRSASGQVIKTISQR
ncbi:MAG TPA: hypothetical protein VMB27_19960 [Solirubrobacteraceae bacterium]|nr:hypothetical protein [Solirubrobacteraceae bacterium]